MGGKTDGGDGVEEPVNCEDIMGSNSVEKTNNYVDVTRNTE